MHIDEQAKERPAELAQLRTLEAELDAAKKAVVHYRKELHSEREESIRLMTQLRDEIAELKSGEGGADKSFQLGHRGSFAVVGIHEAGHGLLVAISDVVEAEGSTVDFASGQRCLWHWRTTVACDPSEPDDSAYPPLPVGCLSASAPKATAQPEDSKSSGTAPDDALPQEDSHACHSAPPHQREESKSCPSGSAHGATLQQSYAKSAAPHTLAQHGDLHFDQEVRRGRSAGRGLEMTRPAWMRPGSALEAEPSLGAGAYLSADAASTLPEPEDAATEVLASPDLSDHPSQGWEAFQDPQSGKTWWFHEETGRSAWESPH